MAVTDVGIDLGTCSILVYVRGRGVVLKEPSVAAYDRDEDKIRAIGEEARIQLSRSAGNLKQIQPLENGIIADYVVTEQMLRYFIQKAVGRLSFRKPRVCICIPVGLTQVERHAVEMRLPHLTAGSHTVEFRGAAQQENETCQTRISCPEIVPLATGAAADWSSTKIVLTDGATLNLDFGGTLRSGAITLGGSRVTEGTVNAQSHPAYITGTGALEVVPVGTLLIFR